MALPGLKPFMPTSKRGTVNVGSGRCASGPPFSPISRAMGGPWARQGRRGMKAAPGRKAKGEGQ